jgi:hypothetical protein
MKNRLGLGALALSLAACGNNASPDNASAPSASPPTSAGPVATGSSAAPAPSASVDTHGIPIGVPFPAGPIVQALNPKGLPPYTGPSGTLKGTVHVEGDAPPSVPGLKIPSKCGEASATYGTLFRYGLGKTLADVLVAVTGFEGKIVPAAGEAMKITIHGCALAKRTIVATYGQRIEISNLDVGKEYMPYLLGAPTESILVAVGNGAPVKLYPQQPGHYQVSDMLPNPFLTADVFVLAYSTHDVTGLDGQYEIKNIPVGQVKVNAFLPVLARKAAEEKMIEIKSGDNTLDFTIKFDLKTDMAGVALAGSASPAAGSASAAPPPPKKK